MLLGVDLGGTKIESVVLDDAGEILERWRSPTGPERGYEAVLREIEDHVERADRRAGRALPVGIGTPGAVDPKTGLLKNSNTACLRGQPIQRDLGERLARPVRIANDANCFALAEARAGAARGARVVFGVILGTGVGGGVVLDGRVWDGLQGIAGEWGHSPVGGEPARRCYCGQRGCVETRLSGPGFEADYRRIRRVEEAAAGADDVPAPLTTPQILERLDGGEPAALAAWGRYLGFFGEALARVIHVLDPEVIVLGGGMSLNPRLYEEGRAAVEAVLFNERLETPIVQHGLGDSAGVIGAAWLFA